jgi:hypothetical protein
MAEENLTKEQRVFDSADSIGRLELNMKAVSTTIMMAFRWEKSSVEYSSLSFKFDWRIGDKPNC